jgi:NADH dehydrogenase FAD-containing subunit
VLGAFLPLVSAQAQRSLARLGVITLRDKRNLATIGRASAVAEVKHIRLSGSVAWLTWLIVPLRR